jgi:hypothetical protein
MTDQDARPNAAAAGTFSLGGDLLVNRLGFGAMRLTGRGVLARIIHERLRKLLKERAISIVPDVPRPDARGPS